jgi:hypothetical protein
VQGEWREGGPGSLTVGQPLMSGGIAGGGSEVRCAEQGTFPGGRGAKLGALDTDTLGIYTEFRWGKQRRRRSNPLASGTSVGRVARKRKKYDVGNCWWWRELGCRRDIKKEVAGREIQRAGTDEDWMDRQPRFNAGTG